MNQYKVTIKRGWKDDDGYTVMDAVLVGDSAYDAATRAMRPFDDCASKPGAKEMPLVITVVSVL